jgi:hypothetical protein
MVLTRLRLLSLEDREIRRFSYHDGFFGGDNNTGIFAKGIFRRASGRGSTYPSLSISLTNLVNNTLQEKHPLLHRTRLLPAFVANNNSLPAPFQTQHQRRCLGHRTSLLPGHSQLIQWQD